MNLLIDLDELKAELSAIEAESIGWIALYKQKDTNKRTPTLFNIKSVMR